MSESSERQAGEGMLFTMTQDLIRHVLSSELCLSTCLDWLLWFDILFIWCFVCAASPFICCFDSNGPPVPNIVLKWFTLEGT